MLVRLSVSQWTARKYDKKVSNEVIQKNNATSKAGRFNKVLIAQEEINKINAIQQQARLYHYSVTLPWVDDGSRILPSALYMAYSQKMREYRSEFDSVVADFIVKYPELKEQQRVTLGDMYQESDYPNVESIKGKFAFGVDVYPLPIASDFRVNLQADEVESIRKDIEAKTNNILENTKKELYERLYKVVGHLADKLSTPDAMFKNSIIGNICDLCNMLPALNITEDKKLEELRKRIEENICTKDPQEFREDKEARETTAKEAQDILSIMEGYIG